MSLSSSGSCGCVGSREVPGRVWIRVCRYFEARVTFREGPDRRPVPLDEETLVQIAIFWMPGEVLRVHGSPECTGTRPRREAGTGPVVIVDLGGAPAAPLRRGAGAWRVGRGGLATRQAPKGSAACHGTLVSRFLG
ncbi:hypothetical protein GCM10010276_72000 [Streptomyces longisporus]|uniref:Uncharacterized protein n=1 Tax=Streptomyces longisporus TaxID=1948 RepID=A0ABN3N3N2_STRLO